MDLLDFEKHRYSEIYETAVDEEGYFLVGCRGGLIHVIEY